MSNGEFAGGGGVTRVTSLPTPIAGLRGIIFYLSQDDNGYPSGYYVVSEDSLQWELTGKESGKVYITLLEPTPGQTSKAINTNDDGNTSNTVVFEATGNTDLVRVHVRAIGSSSYKPAVTINVYDSLGDLIPGQSQAVNFTAPDGDGPEWESYVDIDVGADSGAPYDVTIEAVHTDGARHFTSYHVVFGPVITNLTFVSELEALGSGHSNKYPLTGWSAQQSEVKSGDTVYIKVECDVGAPAMTGIYVYGQVNDLRTTTINDIACSSGWVGYFSISVNNSIVGATARGLKIKAHKSDGVFGEDYTSVDTLLHNNIYPTVSFGTMTYPVGQSALKDTESASVTVVTSGADNVRVPEASLIGTSLVIDSVPSSAGGSLVVHRNGASAVLLLETGSNISMQVFRSANGRVSSVASTLFWIQDTWPAITVTEPAARLRSGGLDGTAIQSHTISLVSNQNITAAPVVNISHATSYGWATSSTFSGSGNNWSNTLRVHDSDPKGTFSWTSIVATNRSGRVTTTISGNSTYVLGGFVERTITVDPYANANQYQFNVLVTDTSKLLCYNVGELNDWYYYNDELDHNDGFTILDSYGGSVTLGNVWKSIDATFNGARTVPYDVRLEEVV